MVWWSDAKKQKTVLYKLSWQNRDYLLGPVDFHHTSWAGRTRLHYFSLCDQELTICFKLLFDTETLQWTLEEVADALGA